MDLARHLPSLDPGLRAALEAMTDPDPDRRPQRSRDVIALLATGAAADKKAGDKKAALVATRPAPLAPRRKIFRDVPEPLATFLRLGLLGFAGTGWAGMAAARLTVLITFSILSVLAMPRRKTVREVGHDVDSLLADGQHGFADLARMSLGRGKK
jgi:hypothetical protein